MRWTWIPTISQTANLEVKTTTASQHDSLSPSKSNFELARPLKSCMKKPNPGKVAASTIRDGTPDIGSSLAVKELTRVEERTPVSYQDFLARFSRREKLNEGSTGIATRALDKIMGNVVVLKQYNPRYRKILDEMQESGMPTTEKHRMVFEEVYLDRCRTSPHIIDLLVSFEDPLHPSRATLVLEYAEHGDLYDYYERQRRARKSAPEPLLWHWMLQMAKAIKFLHDDLGENAIIHCDIKPENWLLTAPRTAPWAYPDIKLTDFDLARFERDGPKPIVAGTPTCQPPEHPRDTKAADVWAVGACIYRVTTGSYPIQPLAPGMYTRLTERQQTIYEVDAERVVEDVTEYGYSLQLKEILEGRHMVGATLGRPCVRGGLLNFDVEERFTAAQLVEELERMRLEETESQVVSDMMGQLKIDSEESEERKSKNMQGETYGSDDILDKKPEEI